MEGVARLPLQATELSPWRQRTLKVAIDCTGIGVHSGQRVHLAIRPAGIDHGIVFRRTDLGRSVAARYDHVVDTRLCTALGDAALGDANLGGATMRVGTVEHLMAALSAYGIDNALIDVSGSEVPILDGSAAPFLFLLDCAGIAEQDAPRGAIEVRRTVRVAAGDAWAELRPLGPVTRADRPVLDMDVTIDFPAAAIGRQSASIRLAPNAFRSEVAAARTFANFQEVEQLRAAGLARGGSLGNAVVVNGAAVLNPGGLRMRNEFASHKLVDAVGDLALAAGPLHGRFVAHRPGHQLNNQLLRALFADPSAWRCTALDPLEAVA